MRKLFYFILVFIATNASAQYVSGGPDGGHAFGFYRDGGRTWVASNTGTYFSEDNGITWHASTLPPSPMTCDIVRSVAAFGNEIYVGAQTAGVYRSADGGVGWGYVNNTLLKGIPYTDAEIIGPAALVIRSDSGFLYRTTDQGASWVPMNFAMSNASARWLSTNNNALYVTTDQGLFKSMDNGFTYNNINPLATNLGKLIWVNDTAYASSTNGGVMQSVDDGATFNTIGLAGRTTHNVAVIGKNIYATVRSTTGQDTLKYSTDAGNSFNNASFPTSVPFQTVNDLIVAGPNVLAGTTYGIYRSATGTFVRSDSGFRSTMISAMAVNGLRLYAATTQMGIFYTPDSGENWVHNGDMAHGIDPIAFAVDAKNQYVHGGGNGGYYRSSNFGQSWAIGASGLPAGSNVSSIYASKTSPDVFLIRNGNLYHSSDDGASFSTVSSGIPAGTASFVTKADTSLFASASGGLYKGNSSHAFTLVTGITGRVTSVVFRGAEYYASTAGSGLFSSMNGLNWKAVTLTAPDTLPANINALVVNGSFLVAATDDGLFTDSTGVWTQDSLRGRAVYTLAVMDGKVYAGTCSGVWTRQNLPSTPGVGVGGTAVTASSQLQVYPNPSSGTFKAVFRSAKAGEAVLSLQDMLGHTVLSRAVMLGSGSNELQVSTGAANLPAGIYMLRIKSDDGAATQRVILQ